MYERADVPRYLPDRSRAPAPLGCGELWIGGYPAPWDDLACFDVVVSAVMPGEPQTECSGGLLLKVPFEDRAEAFPAEAVRLAAGIVAAALKHGCNILVHCGAGLNRSGVIVVRALMYLDVPEYAAVAMLRKMRSPDVLCNKGFVRWLESESSTDSIPQSNSEVSADTTLPKDDGRRCCGVE